MLQTGEGCWDQLRTRGSVIKQGSQSVAANRRMLFQALPEDKYGITAANRASQAAKPVRDQAPFISSSPNLV